MTTALTLARALASVAQQQGLTHVYVVGGAVRNYLCGLPVKDIDIVVDTIRHKRSSEEIATLLCDGMGAPHSITTNQYGVAIVTLGDFTYEGISLRGEVIEIAAARRESYGGEGGKGYKPSSVEYCGIQEDLARRDFRVNTLMWRLCDLDRGPEGVEVLDLLGGGLTDLQERVLRCPMDPVTTFCDDPSRLIRFARFHVRYGFGIAPETLCAALQTAQQIHAAPHNAISKLVCELLTEQHTEQVVGVFGQLGLLPCLVQLCGQTPQFRDALQNHASTLSVRLCGFLMSVGLAQRTKRSVLSPKEQQALLSVTLGWDASETETLLGVLRQPGRILPMESLAALRPEMGQRAFRHVTEVCREVLLQSPTLLYLSEILESQVRSAVVK